MYNTSAQKYMMFRKVTFPFIAIASSNPYKLKVVPLLILTGLLPSPYSLLPTPYSLLPTLDFIYYAAFATTFSLAVNSFNAS